ncbi:hypothetical protein HAX54_004323, partial [Datura stramonium]|nr:hypothetical protein [Datura stramonium]
ADGLADFNFGNDSKENSNSKLKDNKKEWSHLKRDCPLQIFVNALLIAELNKEVGAITINALAFVED